MAWQVKVQDEFEKDILKPIIKEVVEILQEENIPRYDEDAIDEKMGDIIFQVLDGRLIYNWDRLAVLAYYGHIEDGFDAAWEDLENDVWNDAKDMYMEEVD